jgi:hypothetical protein
LSFSHRFLIADSDRSIEQRRALFVAPIANLKAAGARTLDNDIAMPRAQFDLPNVSPGTVNLIGDQSCALQASALFAS